MKKIQNINLTDEQISNAQVHFFDTLFFFEVGNTRLTALTDILHPVHPKSIDEMLELDDLVFVNFEVAEWDDEGPIDSTVQFFPEDFDSAMEEFKKRTGGAK